MRVCERGVGQTFACGSGECETVVAGSLTNKLNRRAVVHLKGGSGGKTTSGELSIIDHRA